VNGQLYVQGKVQAAIKRTYQDHYDSCMFDQNGNIVPCSYTGPSKTIDWHIGFSVDYQPWSKSTTTFHVSWWVPDPSIGIAAGSPYPTNCFQPYMWYAFPAGDTVQQQPVSAFTAAGPHTLTFSGKKQFTDSYGGKRDYTWTLSVTYQPVDQ
jgi:hypothetical protein